MVIDRCSVSGDVHVHGYGFVGCIGYLIVVIDDGSWSGVMLDFLWVAACLGEPTRDKDDGIT